MKTERLSTLELEFFCQLRLCDVPEPETQYLFHPRRKWLFDFAWPDRMVAVEIQGGGFVGGKHGRGSGMRNDCEKISTAVAMGWRVLQFVGDQVKDGFALQMTLKTMGMEK